MRKFIFVTGLMMAPLAGWAYDLNVNAEAAYLYHPATQTPVYTLNEDEQIAPASLTKLMTLYLLFDALEKGDVTLQTALPVSEKAWRKGGSKMFVEVGTSVTVDNLISGITTSSGNDACIVVAEYLGGTEEGFAQMMNAQAKELGMTGTIFTNATGWPDELMKTTAADMGKLAAAIIQNFPQYYDRFSQPQFTFSNITQSNRNRLLGKNGVDGMKTGHTEDAGYHLVASADQDGERLVSVMMGTNGFTAREGESLKLLNYGFRLYDTVTLWQRGAEVITTPVWGGIAPEVTLETASAAAGYLPKDTEPPFDVQIKYAQNLPAPITPGQKLGTLTYQLADKTYTTDLVAARGIPESDPIAKTFQKLFYRLGL